MKVYQDVQKSTEGYTSRFLTLGISLLDQSSRLNVPVKVDYGHKVSESGPGLFTCLLFIKSETSSIVYVLRR